MLQSALMAVCALLLLMAAFAPARIPGKGQHVALLSLISAFFRRPASMAARAPVQQASRMVLLTRLFVRVLEVILESIANSIIPLAHRLDSVKTGVLAMPLLLVVSVLVLRATMVLTAISLMAVSVPALARLLQSA